MFGKDVDSVALEGSAVLVVVDSKVVFVVDSVVSSVVDFAVDTKVTSVGGEFIVDISSEKLCL